MKTCRQMAARKHTRRPRYRHRGIDYGTARRTTQRKRRRVRIIIGWTDAATRMTRAFQQLGVLVEQATRNFRRLNEHLGKAYLATDRREDETERQEQRDACSRCSRKETS